MSCEELPVREISSQADLDQFLESKTLENLFVFIQRLSKAVQGRAISSVCLSQSHENVRWACQVLERMHRLVKEYPSDKSNASSRYGNPRFRDWLDEMRRLLPRIHYERAIPDANQVASYLLNSLGDYQRIDYGTGHEAHFLAWLYCLAHPATGPFLPIKLDGANDEIAASMVMLIFAKYLKLMRTLQATYWLEPAGSHGVWGLDDYHFLPFLWGASQLIGHPHLRPKSIHEPEVVEQFAPDYLYLDCIHQINVLKHSASLRWHSPLLDDISAVANWEKLCSGLLKMYRVEVFGKVPIMQHFLFGKIISFKSTAPPELETAGGAYSRRHNLRGDCCGNPLPSIYAAAEAERGQSCRHPSLNKLPFD